jgi:hypothetical protein
LECVRAFRLYGRSRVIAIGSMAMGCMVLLLLRW